MTIGPARRPGPEGAASPSVDGAAGHGGARVRARNPCRTSPGTPWPVRYEPGAFLSAWRPCHAVVGTTSRPTNRLLPSPEEVLPADRPGVAPSGPTDGPGGCRRRRRPCDRDGGRRVFRCCRRLGVKPLRAAGHRSPEPDSSPRRRSIGGHHVQAHLVRFACPHPAARRRRPDRRRGRLPRPLTAPASAAGTTGTASPSASPPATGASTPATATTAACSSPATGRAGGGAVRPPGRPGHAGEQQIAVAESCRGPGPGAGTNCGVHLDDPITGSQRDAAPAPAPACAPRRAPGGRRGSRCGSGPEGSRVQRVREQEVGRHVHRPPRAHARGSSSGAHAIEGGWRRCTSSTATSCGSPTASRSARSSCSARRPRRASRGPNGRRLPATGPDRRSRERPGGRAHD